MKGRRARVFTLRVYRRPEAWCQDRRRSVLRTPRPAIPSPRFSMGTDRSIAPSQAWIDFADEVRTLGLSAHHPKFSSGLPAETIIARFQRESHSL
jgi:hypothetical protein